MQDGTEITLCGRLRAHVAGQAREDQLHGRQGRLLFAFLVLNRQRPTSRDALVEAIWGEDGTPPSEGRWPRCSRACAARWRRPRWRDAT